MSLQGFIFPRSRSGRASLLPSVPWHYSGQMLRLEYRSDPEAVAELLPPGLAPRELIAGYWREVAMSWRGGITLERYNLSGTGESGA